MHRLSAQFPAIGAVMDHAVTMQPHQLSTPQPNKRLHTSRSIGWFSGKQTELTPPSPLRIMAPETKLGEFSILTTHGIIHDTSAVPSEPFPASYSIPCQCHAIAPMSSHARGNLASSPWTLLVPLPHRPSLTSRHPYFGSALWDRTTLAWFASTTSRTCIPQVC